MREWLEQKRYEVITIILGNEDCKSFERGVESMTGMRKTLRSYIHTLSSEERTLIFNLIVIDPGNYTAPFTNAGYVSLITSRSDVGY